MWSEMLTPIWESIMIVTRALPRGDLSPLDKSQIVEFLRAQMPVIPCGGCSLKATLYYAQHIPDFKTGDDAFHWVIDFHNHVNVSIGKREYTYEEAEKELNERANKNYRALSRDQQRQKIDHKKIKSLQTELDLFRNIPHATTNQSLLVYIIIGVVIACAILMLLIAFFAVMVRQMRHLERATALASIRS